MCHCAFFSLVGFYFIYFFWGGVCWRRVFCYQDKVTVGLGITWRSVACARSYNAKNLSCVKFASKGQSWCARQAIFCCPLGSLHTSISKERKRHVLRNDGINLMSYFAANTLPNIEVWPLHACPQRTLGSCGDCVLPVCH